VAMPVPWIDKGMIEADCGSSGNGGPACAFWFRHIGWNVLKSIEVRDEGKAGPSGSKPHLLSVEK